MVEGAKQAETRLRFLRLRRLLIHRRLPVFVALVGIFLCLPLLWAGFNGDDYFQRAILLGVSPVGEGTEPVSDLFRFVWGGEQTQRLIDWGFFPWWTNPELRIGLWRPLTVATHLLDYQYWPDLPVLQHVHSLLWFGLGLFLVAMLYRRVHGVGLVAGLAALLFALEDAHSMPAGWIANRNALLSLVFGTLVILAHLAWRRSGKRRFLLGGLAALVLGLLCGEATLGALGYVFAWELTMGKGSWSNRLGALVPAALVVVLWRLQYNNLGYGTTGSGLYLDPGKQPGEFVLALAERWPLLLIDQWTQIDVDAWAFLSRSGQLVCSGVAALLCLGLLVLLWRLLRAQALARFWALGMAFSLVPLCAAFPMSRLLVFPEIGAFGLLALFIESMGWPGKLDRQRSRLSRAATWVLLVLHGPVAALMLVGRAFALPLFGSMFAAGATGAPMDDALTRQTLIFVNGNDFSVAYTSLIRQLDASGPVPRRVAMLSNMTVANKVFREDPFTLVITPQGGLLANSIDRLMRGLEPPFVKDDEIRMVDFTIQIRSITTDGRPAQMAFRFHKPLNDPSYRWVSWQPRGLVEFPIPDVGDTRTLPPVSHAEAAFRSATGTPEQQPAP